MSLLSRLGILEFNNQLEGAISKTSKLQYLDTSK